MLEVNTDPKSDRKKGLIIHRNIWTEALVDRSFFF
jgi:hypothetical protein